MALSGPAEHLSVVGEETDGLPVSAAVDHGIEQRPNIVLGHIVHRCLAECGVKVLFKAPLNSKGYEVFIARPLFILSGFCPYRLLALGGILS